MKPVKLTSGETVHFKPWKRKAQRLFKATLKEGVFLRRDLDTGKLSPVEEIPAGNFDRAYEAVLPIVIEKVERDGGEVPFSEAWLNELEGTDYDLLERAVYELKEAAKASADKSA